MKLQTFTLYILNKLTVQTFVNRKLYKENQVLKRHKSIEILLSTFRIQYYKN